jgi:hypothetical protein
MPPTPDYIAKWKIGHAYEAYIVDRLRAMGVTVDQVVGRTAQLIYGDTTIGWEIKCDQRSHETGNLCIETAEQAEADPSRPMVASGIYREDQCRWYAIGDYRHLWVFRKTTLQAEDGRHRTYRIPTSVGFLLPRRQADRLAQRTWHWPDRRPLGEKIAACPSCGAYGCIAPHESEIRW